MTCQDAMTQLHLQLDDQPCDAVALSRHVAECPACAGRLAAYNAMRAACLEAPMEAAPASLLPTLTLRLRKKRTLFGLNTRHVAGAAAALVLGIAIWAMMPLLPDGDNAAVRDESAFFTSQATDWAASGDAALTQNGVGMLPESATSVEDSYRNSIDEAIPRTDAPDTSTEKAPSSAPRIPDAETAQALADVYFQAQYGDAYTPGLPLEVEYDALSDVWIVTAVGSDGVLRIQLNAQDGQVQ